MTRTATPATETTRERFREMTAKTMSEKTLLQLVTDAARAFGASVYHTHDSRRSTAGFPDLCILFPGAIEGDGRLIWAELKTERGQLSDAQWAWLTALEDAGQVTYIWRPSQWMNGDIEAVLRHRGES